MPKKLDLTGKRFGKLLVVGPAGKRGSKNLWLCLCDCGGSSTPETGCLTRGGSLSCGCYMRENFYKFKIDTTTHGKSNTKTYRIWHDMKRRCTDPSRESYENYGGRGISFDPRWSKFENFFADMGECPGKDFSLDRVNNDGNYEKSNCRWADKYQQANNRRNNRRIKVKDEILTLTQAAEKYGVKYRCAIERLNRGWTPEETFITGRNHHETSTN